MKDIGYFGVDSVELSDLSQKQAARLIAIMSEEILQSKHVKFPESLTNQTNFDALLKEPEATIKWAAQYL